MSPALTDVGFDASRLREVELYDLTVRLENLEKTDSPAADQAVSLLYLANQLRRALPPRSASTVRLSATTCAT
jgi:hypothetical protein